MKDGKDRVCPVERAGSLDNRIRRWLQNPNKILKPYLEEGMSALDYGCGPGFFSLEMARLVGASGRVIAADIQEGMLAKVRAKIQGTELENRIILHKSESDQIGLSEEVDFILAFYVMHELPDQDRFFKEAGSILKPNGHVLIVEPPFHVSKSAFSETIDRARNAGLSPVGKLKLRLNRTAVLRKS